MAEGTEGTTGSQLPPPSRESSRRTFSTPSVAQEILCREPAGHASPPFGATMRTLWAIENGFLDLAESDPSEESETRTTHSAEWGGVTVHECEPASAGADATTSSHVAPPSRDSSTRTPDTFSAVQLIVCLEPAIHSVPPVGAVSRER